MPDSLVQEAHMKTHGCRAPRALKLWAGSSGATGTMALAATTQPLSCSTRGRATACLSHATETKLWGQSTGKRAKHKERKHSLSSSVHQDFIKKTPSFLCIAYSGRPMTGGASRTPPVSHSHLTLGSDRHAAVLPRPHGPGRCSNFVKRESRRGLPVPTSSESSKDTGCAR